MAGIATVLLTVHPLRADHATLRRYLTNFRRADLLPTSRPAQSDPFKCAKADALACRSYGILCQLHDSLDCAMPTRNVVLTDYQAALVERLVASGRYQNASEVLREGLRLIENREAEAKVRLKALRDAARIGIADIEEGRFRSFNSADAIRGHLEAVAAEAIPVGEAGHRSK
jgi:antitoxin ParD1/3/4